MQAESRSSHISLLLKLAGVALILGIIVDYLTLAVPPNFLNNEWLANLIDQFVGRGVVPLLGLALLFLGVGIESSTGRTAQKLLAPAVMVAIGFGLMFLLFTPLYFNSNRLVSATTTQNINKEAEKAAQQLERQLAMRQGQVKELIGNSQQLAALNADLQNEQITEADKAQLKELKETLDRVKNDPKLLEQEVLKARSTGIKQIEERQDQAKKQLQEEMRRARMRITAISFVLSIGYLIIGWTGFGVLKASQPSRPARTKKSSGQKRMRRGKA
jgi:hypothetical protein